jgi:hypothetical protein
MSIAPADGQEGYVDERRGVVNASSIDVIERGVVEKSSVVAKRCVGVVAERCVGVVANRCVGVVSELCVVPKRCVVAERGVVTDMGIVAESGVVTERSVVTDRGIVRSVVTDRGIVTDGCVDEVDGVTTKRRFVGVGSTDTTFARLPNEAVKEVLRFLPAWMSADAAVRGNRSGANAD